MGRRLYLGAMLCICKVLGAGFSSGSLVLAMIFFFFFWKNYSAYEFNFKSNDLFALDYCEILSNNQALDGLGLRWGCQLIILK
jgi:hypothetical protein